MSETKKRFIEINNSNLVYLEDIIALNIGVNNASLLLVYVNYTETPLMVYYKNAEECKEAYDSLVKILKDDNNNDVVSIDSKNNEIVDEEVSRLVCIKNNVFYYDNDQELIKEHINLTAMHFQDLLNNENIIASKLVSDPDKGTERKQNKIVLFCHENTISIYNTLNDLTTDDLITMNLINVNFYYMSKKRLKEQKELISIFKHVVDIEFDSVADKNHAIKSFFDIDIDENKVNTSSLQSVPYIHAIINYFIQHKIILEGNII